MMMLLHLYNGIKKHKDVLTIIILIAGIIGTIWAAYAGASEQAKLAYNYEIQKNEIREQNIAKLLYIDIRNQNAMLDNDVRRFNNEEAIDPNRPMNVIGESYSDNGIYFAYQNEIASFDYPIAKNITQFYTDLIQSDKAIDETAKLMAENNSNAIVTYRAYKAEIRDAQKLSPIVQDQLVKRYNITPDFSLTLYQ